MSLIDRTAHGVPHLENPFEVKSDDDAATCDEAKTEDASPAIVRKEPLKLDSSSSILTNDTKTDDARNEPLRLDSSSSILTQASDEDTHIDDVRETKEQDECKQQEQHVTFSDHQALDELQQAITEGANALSTTGATAGMKLIDEDAVQDALIQAAEDAMRYAYEESARTTTFEQHQLAELLVRQKQGLLRLEELDSRMQAIEINIGKVVSQISSLSPPRALPDAEERLTLDKIQSSTPTGQASQTPSLHQSSPQIQHKVLDEPSQQNQLPLFARRGLVRMLQMIELAQKKLLSRMRFDSWAQLRSWALRGIRSVVRVIQVRLLGVYDKMIPRDDLKMRKELEDELLVGAGLVSSIVTMALLVWYKRHQSGQLMMIGPGIRQRVHLAVT